ncbi:conserved hypothetical protein [Microsporum canis CBS 113480]|uniref:Altered inheritance of mitochondria protein 9, mitochondrial n=1 Tax=Arthroderma otae (strain ATCC MYA-4605 / CBS 113480) TaxID=554155 RepID=C5FPZ5_ARTOC|nr:conserved hypothetical protein [Microsporum canis CBS 113480]EEQ31948.1 conserved hypothetical protein [Microsporum canis CBS 113480]
MALHLPCRYAMLSRQVSRAPYLSSLYHTLSRKMGGSIPRRALRPSTGHGTFRHRMKSLTRLFQGPDPYSYTAGRWLNRDELQRTSRALNFDFPLLCEMAVKSCRGASKAIGYEKKEGGYNRVFIFTMDTGRRIVARVPTQVAGPPKLTTNSEVATVAYLRLKTALPIPNILLWSDDPSNPVGIEYIIQEYAEGVQCMNSGPHGYVSTCFVTRTYRLS